MQIAAILIIGLAASPLHPRPSPQSQARPPPSGRPRRPPFSGMLIAESFTGRVRYSGASLGYHLASVIAGGPAPLIATWLYAEF